MGDRTGDQLGQDFLVDFLEVLDVETRLAGGVTAQPTEQFPVPVEAIHDVQRQVLLPWGEAHLEPLVLGSAALWRVPVRAIADDCVAPHLGLLPGRFRHQVLHREGITAAGLVVHGVEERIHFTGVSRGFQLRHRFEDTRAMKICRTRQA